MFRWTVHAALIYESPRMQKKKKKKKPPSWNSPWKVQLIKLSLQIILKGVENWEKESNWKT
jgi:hypothetical protein